MRPSERQPALVALAVPVAITVLPGEISQPPRSWAERAYPHLFYLQEVDKGGHFAAWEEPELLAAELRAASDHNAWPADRRHRVARLSYT